MQKHKLPSHVRYERRHPSISFSLDSELKERLKEMLKKQSFASFVKEALGVKERERKSLEDAHAKGYNEGLTEGYEKGYDKATERFGIHTVCAVCGKSMVVRSPEGKGILSRFIREQRWGHPICMEEVKRRRRIYER